MKILKVLEDIELVIVDLEVSMGDKNKMHQLYVLDMKVKSYH